MGMLYELCPICGGKGTIVASSNNDPHPYQRPCMCKILRVVEVGVTTGQLERLVALETQIKNPDPDDRR